MKIIFFSIITASLTFAQGTVVSPKIQKEGEKILVWVQDPVLIEAIRKQNKAETSIQEVLKLDREWIEGTISEDFVKAKLQGPCADRLNELQKGIPSAGESFVMDAQGALVCATKKTSDYWQGDEPKWKDAFEASTNLVFGSRSYDASTKATLLPISAVVKENKKPIGVVCVGINLMLLSEE